MLKYDIFFWLKMIFVYAKVICSWKGKMYGMAEIQR